MNQAAALVLGAETPLGAGLIQQLSGNSYSTIILSGHKQKLGVIRGLADHFGLDGRRFSIVELNQEKPFAGLSGEILNTLAEQTVDVFQLALRRDRTLGASVIKRDNELMTERAIGIGYKLPGLRRLIMVTDTGIIGDYPGRFSENWTDVGQTPFDEVDKSSLATELTCVECEDLPIVRARVGLYFGPRGIPKTIATWVSSQEELIRSAFFLKKFPSFVKIPVAIAPNALAPITPVTWASKALICLAKSETSTGKAFHLVLRPSPKMDDVLYESSALAGGAKLRGGLPINLIAKLGFIPGFKETARRNADQIAAWWTPHRYCLSRNDLDTANLDDEIPKELRPPTWNRIKQMFF